ncbi:hypothetical protein NIES4073_55740 [Kalymmatonema gypsitolerans NIES-4073]|nr:hypothetical protein NIES4073_55740 [Scytonema sp. NIES-4073]
MARLYIWSVVETRSHESVCTFGALLVEQLTSHYLASGI